MTHKFSNSENAVSQEFARPRFDEELMERIGRRSRIERARIVRRAFFAVVRTLVALARFPMTLWGLAHSRDVCTQRVKQ